MFFLAFLAAFFGSTGWVVAWAVIGLLISRRSFVQSLILIGLTMISLKVVMIYIGVWWIMTLLGVTVTVVNKRS